MQDKYELVSNPSEDFFVVRKYEDGKLYRAYRRRGTPIDYQDEIFASYRLGRDLPRVSVLADVVAQYDDTFMIYTIPQSTSIVPFDPDMDEEMMKNLLYQLLQTIVRLREMNVRDVDLSLENLEVDMDNNEILLLNAGRSMSTSGPDNLRSAFYNLLLGIWRNRSTRISDVLHDLIGVSYERNIRVPDLMFHPFFNQAP